MKNLDYKGWKSTRVGIALALFVFAAIALGVHWFTADNFISFVEWVFGTYAASEVGAKGASAYAASKGAPQ